MANIDSLNDATLDSVERNHAAGVGSWTPLHLSFARLSLYKAFGKRLLDILLVLIVLPVILPITLVFIFLVWLDGGHPLYSQLRVGREGRDFRLWKLRSMCIDADEVLAKHLANDAEMSAEWEAHQKLKCDPRVTKIGRFIRKRSVDELPQLWNVLFGDMSLVGPRPMMLSQKCIYPGESYYDLRPGITGNWQVSQRNKATFADRAKFDHDYLETVSLGTDLAILAKTIPAVIRGTGH